MTEGPTIYPERILPPSEIAYIIYGTANILFPKSLTGQSSFIAATCLSRGFEAKKLSYSLLSNSDLIFQIKNESLNPKHDSPIETPIKIVALRKAIKKVFLKAQEISGLPIDAYYEIMENFAHVEESMRPNELHPTDFFEEKYAAQAKEIIAKYRNEGGDI